MINFTIESLTVVEVAEGKDDLIKSVQQAPVDLVDRPTQLICISDVHLSTDKYKRHGRAIC